jgi:hypothetical protein
LWHDKIIQKHAYRNIYYENEVEVPPSVINQGFFIIIQFLSPLHVSASSGHPQKERGKVLMYQDQAVITNPIPHASLLCMWELFTLVRHSTSCIRIICSSENPKDCLWWSNPITINYTCVMILLKYILLLPHLNFTIKI